MFANADKVIFVMVELSQKELDEISSGKEIRTEAKKSEELDYPVVVQVFCSNPEKK